MNRKEFTVAVAVVILAGHAHSTPARENVDSRGIVSGGMLRMAPLSEVPSILGRGVSPRESQPVTTNSVALTSTDDPTVAWVEASDLADEIVREEARAAYRSGMPVLVTSGGSELGESGHGASATFGAASLAPLAYYYRTSNGGLRTLSMTVPGSDGDDVLARIHTDLISELGSRALQTGRLAESPVELPSFSMTDTAYGTLGSFVTHEVTVLRDSAINHDDKVVVANASYNIVPAQVDGSRSPLRLIERYVMRQSLGLNSAVDDDNKPFDPVLLRHYPESTGSTDIELKSSQKTTVSYGYNIAANIDGGLTGSVPWATAKLAFSYNFSKVHTDEKAYRMLLKDYYVAASASRPFPSILSMRWDLPLSETIKGNPGYFGWPATPERVTPMMLRASAQTYAVWRVAGYYDEAFQLEAWPSAVDRAAFGESRDRVRLYTEAPSGMPASRILMPRKNPFLTREITVFIQSQSLGGNCLRAESWTVDKEVFLARCSGDLADRDAQWNLDSEGRYRHFGTGLCMALNTLTGAVALEKCSLASNQWWKWKAEGIFSKYNSGQDGWRLHVKNGRVHGVTDPAKYQIWPENPHHPLLKPWSTYPLAPVAGAVVPNIQGSPSEPIPPSWVNLYGPVSADELWDIVPVRTRL